MNVPLVNWDTRNLLFNHIGKAASGLLVGGDAEAPRRYFSCSVERLEIGIIVNQPAHLPCVLAVPRSSRLFIGYDQSVAIIDVTSIALLNTMLLEGVFFEFLPDYGRQQILAIHELGVVALSLSGNVVWRFITPDIVENWQIVHDCLSLTVMDQRDKITLNVADGKYCHFVASRRNE